EAAALAALRRIQTRAVKGEASALKVTLPSDVALYLLNQKRQDLLDLERRYWGPISLHPRPDSPKGRVHTETTAPEGWGGAAPPRPRPGARLGDEKRLAEPAHERPAEASIAPAVASEPAPASAGRSAKRAARGKAAKGGSGRGATPAKPAAGEAEGASSAGRLS